MSERIVAGDRCRIVMGLARHKSPNIGKEVVVKHDVIGSQGIEHHSRFGRIVRVEGPEVYQMDDTGAFINHGWADIPVSWLEKLPPATQGPKTVREKEHA